MPSLAVHILLFAAFAASCPGNAQGPARLLVDAGFGVTQGALIPFEEAETNGRTAGRSGFTYRVGLISLLHGTGTSLCFGVRLGRSVNRVHVDYEVTESWSPSSLKRVEHEYAGVVTTERFAVSIPVQLWLRLGARHRLILGMDARFAASGSITEEGVDCRTETRYTPQYQVQSVISTEQSYTRVRSNDVQRGLHLGLGGGYRFIIRERLFMGPDASIVFPVRVMSNITSPMVEAGISFSLVLGSAR